MGGLGNQLFQLFTTIAYSIENNSIFIFPYSTELRTGITRPTYWDSFLSGIKSFTTFKAPKRGDDCSNRRFTKKS